MKLLTGNGAEVEIRDVGPVLFRMELNSILGMLPLHGWKILTDDAARQFVKDNKSMCKCENLKEKTNE